MAVLHRKKEASYFNALIATVEILPPYNKANYRLRLLKSPKKINDILAMIFDNTPNYGIYFHVSPILHLIDELRKTNSNTPYDYSRFEMINKRSFHCSNFPQLMYKYLCDHLVYAVTYDIRMESEDLNQFELLINKLES
ncbi:MAG: hypothetical protein Q7S87_17675 [Agitococcus sp.]|nr:hypothetical protein [Agitococcus sp.]